MSDLNGVHLVGRLTRDPDIKYTNTGCCMCKFGLANNYYHKVNGQGQEDVNYFNIVFWGKRAESLSPYLKKGTLIGLTGQLRQNRWTDDNGDNRQAVEVIVDNIQLMPSNRSNQGQGAGGNDQPAGNNRGEPAIQDTFEDDIPF